MRGDNLSKNWRTMVKEVFYRQMAFNGLIDSTSKLDTRDFRALHQNIAAKVE
jgi:hypothetical protein